MGMAMRKPQLTVFKPSAPRTRWALHHVSTFHLLHHHKVGQEDVGSEEDGCVDTSDVPEWLRPVTEVISSEARLSSSPVYNYHISTNTAVNHHVAWSNLDTWKRSLANSVLSWRKKILIEFLQNKSAPKSHPLKIYPPKPKNNKTIHP